MEANDSNLDKMDWSLTTFEGARRAQIREWSKLNLSEILAMQEEMAGLAKWLKD